MTGVWFKFPGSYFEDIRLFKLRKQIGDDALWLPARLWCFCANAQTDGDLSEHSPESLAEVLRYHGKADLFAALESAGYIDAERCVVDWAGHFSLFESRQRAARKGADGRWLKSSPTPPPERQEETRQEERRGEDHALRDALRDASPPPPLPSAGWPEALASDQVEDVVSKTHSDPDRVRELWGCYRDRKERYNEPFGPEKLAGFRDYVREQLGTRPGRGHTSTHHGAPGSTLATIPEPKGWRAEALEYSKKKDGAHDMDAGSWAYLAGLGWEQVPRDKQRLLAREWSKLYPTDEPIRRAERPRYRASFA